MRTFLSRVFLLALIVSFSVPASLFAQTIQEDAAELDPYQPVDPPVNPQTNPPTSTGYNWTAPNGGPLGNNVAAPLNVSDLEQNKIGGASFGTTVLPANNQLWSAQNTRLDGQTSVNGRALFGYGLSALGANDFINYMPSLFAGSTLQIGSGGNIGTQVNINGKIFYKPTNANGTLVNPANGGYPPNNSVLKAGTNGEVVWGAALPNGVNEGDILIWNSSCECWQTTTNTGGGNLPPGNGWETLSWNPNAPAGWKANNFFNVNTSIKAVYTDKTTKNISLNTDENIPTGGVGVLGRNVTIASDKFNLPLFISSLCAPNCPNPTGKVLTATNSLGELAWVDPSTLGGGGGEGNNTFPIASPGQTMWFNGDTSSWEATSWITHKVEPTFPSTAPGNKTFLKAQRVFTGNENDTAAGIFNVNSRYLNFGRTPITSNGSGGQTSSPSTQETNFLSKSINFGNSTINLIHPDFTNTQNQDVTFYSDNIKFKGITAQGATNNLDPGAGRLAYSADDEGTFKWAKGLVYNLIPNFIIPGYTASVFTLKKPDIGGTTTQSSVMFINQGSSLLQDDVTMMGDLNLEGLEEPTPDQHAAGIVKHICFLDDGEDNKVVKCTGQVDPDPGEPILPGGDGTQIYTSLDSATGYVFNFTGPVSVRYCGGGGGGGGGGIGRHNSVDASNDDQNGVGRGGNGGGGGASGECNTQTINVVPGDRITWNIGSGGAGGSGATYRIPNGGDVVSANGGGTGQITSVSFEPASGSPTVWPTVVGGNGGSPGGSIATGVDFPASHGNITLATGSFAWYFNGGPGSDNVGYYNFGNSAGNTPGSGGIGGVGEQRNLLGELNYNVAYNEPSYRGGGGLAYTSEANPNIPYGGSGRYGALANGGGGGGGGAGKAVTQELLGNNQYQYDFKGGWGGPGGPGYVRISGLPIETASSGERVFDIPGSYTLSSFEINNIPESVTSFNVQMWGAGGGAGSVNTGGSSVKRSGGGGSGEYRTMTLTRSQLLNARFIVGVKGNNGTYTQGATPGTDVSTSGTTGNLSKVEPISYGVTGSFAPLSAAGGGGGQPYTGLPGETRQGGAGGHSMSAMGSWGTAGADGQDGGSNQGPCNLNSEITSPNNGYGNGAPRTCADATLNIYQGSAKNGRVRISW